MGLHKVYRVQYCEPLVMGWTGYTHLQLSFSAAGGANWLQVASQGLSATGALQKPVVVVMFYLS